MNARGLVVPFEDAFLVQLLGYISDGERQKVDEAVADRIDKFA